MHGWMQRQCLNCQHSPFEASKGAYIQIQINLLQPSSSYLRIFQACSATWKTIGSLSMNAHDVGVEVNAPSNHQHSSTMPRNYSSLGSRTGWATRRSNLCHFSCWISAGASTGCLMRSSGLRLTRRLYHCSEASIKAFHHSAADNDRSATIGSTNSSQSPRISGPCWGSQAARSGRSGEPERIVSTPRTTPVSSFPSFILFCISFINSIIKAMNSMDFSVKLESPPPLGLCPGESAASLVVSACPGFCGGGLTPPWRSQLHLGSAVEV